MLILFETVAGYLLFYFEETFSNVIKTSKFQNFINMQSEFFKKIKFKAFAPFRNSKHALENCIHISNSIASEYLQTFLINQVEIHSKFLEIGIEDPKLGIFLQKFFFIKSITNQTVLEIIRGIRLHLEKFTKNFIYKDISKTQCGIAHEFSRSKMCINFKKVDNMIIQSNFLVDQLEKDINIFSTILKEWYSWHFPELVKIINTNYIYALLVKFIGNKKKLNLKKSRELGILLMNEKTGFEIFETSKTSVGSVILLMDVLVIERLAHRIILMSNFKNCLIKYLNKKLNSIAPNLVSILGENLAAKLIVKAGSIKALAKFPSSTIQILGAEKALFRALKKKNKTPKYGILFNSNYISKSSFENKGKISRFLANKCSLATKIDYFSCSWTNIYGKKLKEQIINFLNFYQKN